LLTSGLVVLLFASADKLPAVVRNLLIPGFFVALLINGSLHDRVMPGYAALGVAFNCAFYSTLVLTGIELFKRLRKSG
jgi:hypothetical protein